MIGLATVLVGSLAFAAPPRSDKPKKQKPQQVVPTGAEDAAEPTAAEIIAEQAIEQMTSESAEGLQAVEHPDGTVSVDLEGRFMSIAVATSTPDGKRSVTCHSGHDARERIAAAKDRPSAPAPVAPAPAPAKLEEK